MQSKSKSPFFRTHISDEDSESPLLLGKDDKPKRYNLENQLKENLKSSKKRESLGEKMEHFNSSILPNNSNQNASFFKKNVNRSNAIDFHRRHPSVNASKFLFKNLNVSSIETKNIWFIWMITILPLLLLSLAYYLNISEINQTHILPLNFCTSNSYFDCKLADDFLILEFRNGSNNIGFLQSYLDFHINSKEFCQNIDDWPIWTLEYYLNSHYLEANGYQSLLRKEISPCKLYSRFSRNIDNANFKQPIPYLELNYPQLESDSNLNLMIRIDFNTKLKEPAHSQKIKNLEDSKYIILRQDSYLYLKFKSRDTSTIFSTLSLGLLLLTICFILAFTIINVNHAIGMRESFYGKNPFVSHKKSFYCFILPEQYTISLMLIFLLFWLGPFKIYAILLSNFYPNIVFSDLFLFVSGASITTSKFGMLFCFLCFIEELNFDGKFAHKNTISRFLNPHILNADNEKKSKELGQFDFENKPLMQYEDHLWKVNNKSSTYGATDFHSSNDSFDDLESSSLRPSRSLFGKSIFQLFITKAHPCSKEFVDFLFAKGLLLIVSWSASIIYWSLIFPVLFNYSWHEGQENEFVTVSFKLSKIFLAIITLSWCFYILLTFLNVGYGLKNKKFTDSRFRNIMFRILSIQLLVLGLTFFMVIFFNISHVQMYNEVSFKSASAFINFHIDWLQYFGATEFAPLGPFENNNLVNLMLATILVFSIASFLFPPKRDKIFSSKYKVELSDFQQYFSLEKDIPSIEVKDADDPKKDHFSDIPILRNMIHKKNHDVVRLFMKYFSHHSHLEPFCLETACILLEASYQTYFQLEDDNQQKLSPHSKAIREEDEIVEKIPKMNLKSLGLKFESCFSNQDLNIFGYLGISENKIVASFRGSVHANFPTNMRFSQIPLPRLRKNKSYFLGLIRSDQNAPSDLLDTSFDSTMAEEQWESVIEGSQMNKLKSFFNSTPLLNQSFPRIHYGFWQAYNSIRHQFLKAIMHAVFSHRRRFISIYNEMKKDELHLQASAPMTQLSGLELKNFKQSFDTKQQNYEDCLERVNKTNGLKILICGHSLGAAIATLASLDIALNLRHIIEACLNEELLNRTIIEGEKSIDALAHYKYPVLCLYTYGSPRVGNAAFSKFHNSKIKASYRIAVNGDLVTMLPKLFGFYRHVGLSIVLDEEENGSLLINPSLIEKSFIHKWAGNVVNHSLDKYRNCLEACFDEAELIEYLEKELYLSNSDGNIV